MKKIIEQKRAEYFEERNKHKGDLWWQFEHKINACNELLTAIKPCVWAMNKNKMWWKTTCGKEFAYKYKYCPYCGNEIEEAGK